MRGAGVAWSLGLRAFGRGGDLVRVAPAVPVAHASQVRYVRRGVEEWYAAGPLGLEQGFTLRERPPGLGGGPLKLMLGDLPADVRVGLSQDRRSAVLRRGGRVLLRYGGLFASDASGRSLRAWIEASGPGLTVRVDDRRAQYPLRVDPFVQAGKLTASDGAGGDVLGWSVAISGDTLVVGAPYAKVGANAHQGAAYVFVKPANGWASATETAKLTASDGAVGDQFGYSVAMSGATIVVGAPYAANAMGAAYVFAEPGGGWATGTETAKLTASDGTSNNWFGNSVAVSGDAVAVGAYGATAGGHSFQGAAYMFVRPASGWGSGTPSQAKLTASDGAASDHLGLSVAISGDTLVAGAPNASSGGANGNQGAAYVFVKPVNGWATGTETAKLTSSDGAFGDLLGDSVGVSGDTVGAGAPGAAVSGNGGQGAAYVFVKPANGWATGTETAKVISSDGAAIDQLGSSVSVSGDTLVAGAKGNSSQGAAYVFAKPAGGWGSAPPTQDKLTASDAAKGDEFGSAVGIDSGTVIVGAPDATVSAQADQGAAYVFTSGGGGGGAAPVNTGLPQITDTAGAVPRPGVVLSSSTGSWLNAPTAFAYQWQRCDGAGASCQPIAGATAQTYTLARADVGFTIRVDVSASNSGGSADETSLPTAAVARQLTLAPDKLDFGQISAGNISQPQMVTVSNAGAGALRIVSVALPAGPFKIATDGCSGATLQGGDSCTVAVTFTAPGTSFPQAYGETLAITDDQEPDSATASLTATALPAGAQPIPPGTIFGRVFDAGGAPLAGAGVVIFPTVEGTPGNRVQYLTTAADGSYTSAPLPNGVYQVQVYTNQASSAVVRVNSDFVQQDFDLHAPRPLSGGVTFDGEGGGTATSGVPTTPPGAFSFHVPVHIPTGAPNSVHLFAVVSGIGQDSGTVGSGGDVAGAELFSVFYNAQGWPTRMSRILVGALDCGAPGSPNACARLASAGVGAGGYAAADRTRVARAIRRPAHHPLCDVNGNYVPDKYGDGHFHIIPNDKGGIDFVIPLSDGSPERVGFLWQGQLPVPSPTGDPLRDTFVAVTFGAVNGAFNGAVPAFGYYNTAVGVLNGLAQLSDNPDPVEGGAQGLNAAASLAVLMLNAETHGNFYWFANIVGGDLNAVLPGSPSTSPPANPCPPPPPGGGSGGSGGAGGGSGGRGGAAGGLWGNFYVDPSGVVETRGGVPLAGATVTLTHSRTRSGRQLPVPSGSVVMAPSNRRNPDRTDLLGNFGWDVLPGYYQVSAQKHGCRGSAHTGVLTIPPPFTNLLLHLRCTAAHRTPTRLQLGVIREGAGTTVLHATVASTRRSRNRAAQRTLTGTVTFRIGRTALWSTALDAANGTAGFDVPRLKLHGRFSATYSGNALFAPSHAAGH